MPFPALVSYASAVLHIGEYLLLAREGIKAPASRCRAAFCERLRVQQGRSAAPGPRRTTARRDQRRGARVNRRGPLPRWDHRRVHQHLRLVMAGRSERVGTAWADDDLARLI